jgi:hypothetical protein
VSKIPALQILLLTSDTAPNYFDSSILHLLMLNFIALFQLFQTLKGPIDRTDDRGGRYDQSEAWKELSTADSHWRDFVSLNPEY